ncbi:GntR family transcriptional regulator [Ramlibacter aurantiacus]|uniref:GntR family transcriptional regulator n=1 Tax=Ramlibacter aurantiacus TaxID=2801330 RepID=UPI001F412CA7|nr:GntR family transcriptional regulator [Ramlibacter aurantiacus]
MSDDARRGRGRALYEEIRARVLDGTHAAGTALPSTRALAAERGLSRTTVSAVYDQLAADGFIETRAGAASRVAEGVRPRSMASARPERSTAEGAPALNSRRLSADRGIAEAAYSLECTLALRGGSDPDAGHRHHRLQLQLRRHEGRGRCVHERHDQREFLGRLAREPLVMREHLGCLGGWVHHEAGVHRRDLMQAEGEPGHHAEVASPAAQRPEQLGVLVLVRHADAAVGQHDLGVDEVVAGQPVLA